MTKFSKIFPILKALSFFSEFLTDFLDWNTGEVQQERNVLSNRLFRTYHPVISVKMSQIATENDKKP